MSVAIKVNNVVKKFGDNVIIPGMSVNIKNGEFFYIIRTFRMWKNHSA
ncbi:Fe(3+) ions import ATP-binding protein FbpC [Fusobacterium ulcerans ATCC 49185]|nr:Fe(3+) ions import ATP-binding protein FbpC [Fusobacterium ulcerans ATCC 49185]